MKSDRQILDSEYNEILLQTVAVIEKSRSMLAVQVREGHRVWYVDSFIIGIYSEHNLILFESA